MKLIIRVITGIIFCLLYFYFLEKVIIYFKDQIGAPGMCWWGVCVYFITIIYKAIDDTRIELFKQWQKHD